MRQCDDVEVACRRCEDVNFAHNGFDVRHLEALHARLQGADGIDLGHDDTGTRSISDVSMFLRRSSSPRVGL